MKHLLIFAVLVLIAAMLCSFVPTGDDMQIYSDVVRLHVIANSDSESDQGVKFAVRDKVLSYIGSLTSDAENADDAGRVISENIGAIRSAVIDALDSLGENISADVSLSEEYYPTRSYDDISLPAGKYTSLRIRLGQAEGQNWWCVLYPAICTSSARASTVIKQTGLSTGQINILTEGEKPVYKIKFKLLELFGGASS